MTAVECRARANECIDLARTADVMARAQLVKMAEAWLKLAGTDIERQSEAEAQPQRMPADRASN
jgi:hypothetical protein